MSKMIKTSHELEEYWCCLEKEFFDQADLAIYKAGIDKNKYSDEIHEMKLRVTEIMERRLTRMEDKLQDQDLSYSDVRRYFDRVELSCRNLVNEFIIEWFNDGDLW